MKLTKNELMQHVSLMTGVELDDIPFNVEELISSLASKHGDSYDSKHEFQEADGKDDEKHLLVSFKGAKYYHVSLKRTTWMLLGVLLDLYFTRGTVSVALASVNLNTNIYNSIQYKNGELCVFKVVKENENLIKEEDILNILSEKKCPYEEFKCSFYKEGKCKISSVNISRNLSSLNNKQAISIDNERIVVEI